MSDHKQECHIKRCPNRQMGKICEMHLSKMRRQEEPADTVMDGRGPRGM